MAIQGFLQYLKFEKRYSQHTIIAYETDINQFSDFLKNIYQKNDILMTSHLEVRSWVVSLMEAKVNARSIRRKLSALKTFFKFEMKQGTVLQNPLAKTISPKVAKRLPVFIQKKQVADLWNGVDFGTGLGGARDRIILELFYATGMRRAELIGLTDASVDFYNNSVRVTGKGNKERIIPINDRIKSRLKEYIRLRNQSFQISRFNALLVSDQGKELYPRQVYRIVHKALEKVATVEKKSPHVLRHTFATHMLNSGAEINAIKELLGHASLAATQVYTHNTIDKLKDQYKQAHPHA